MKTILIVLCGLLFINGLTTGCVSTNAVNHLPENSNREENEMSPSKENTTKAKTGSLIEVRLSAKDSSCVKSQTCKVVLDIRNSTNEDVVVNGLVLRMRPSSGNSSRNSPREIISLVSLKTLENLEPDKFDEKLTISANDHLEKEIDLEQIKWSKSQDIRWKYEDLWQFFANGKHRILAVVGYDPKIPSKPIKEKIGEQEIVATRVYNGYSEWLDLELNEN